MFPNNPVGKTPRADSDLVVSRIWEKLFLLYPTTPGTQELLSLALCSDIVNQFVFKAFFHKETQHDPEFENPVHR